jgi:hypothetical protein
MRIEHRAAVPRRQRQAKNVSNAAMKMSGSTGDKPAGNRQKFD